VATPTLFGIDRTDSDHLALTNVWSEAGVLGTGYTDLTVLDVGATSYLIGYGTGANDADVFAIEPGAAPFRKNDAGLALGTGWDALAPFVLGNRPHLMSYRRDRGTFGFFEIGSDLTASAPFRFGHPRDPGLSVGFSEVKPMVCIGQVFFLGYNFDTGNVVLYSLAVTSTSEGGAPPLAAHHVWQRSWAKGWTRFAWFTLGGGNFFLKTNTDRPNVNIDHVRDNPADGTAEVATQMDLQDAQSLDICAAFTLGNGEPYFAAYKKDGTTTLYRFHADCRGWTQVGSAATIPDATHIVPIVSPEATQLLFY